MQNHHGVQQLLAMSAVALTLAAGAVQAQNSQAGKEALGSGSAQSGQAGAMQGSASGASQRGQTSPTQMDGANRGGQTAAGSTAAGATASGGALSKADQTILTGMAQANLAEIEAGKLAQSKSQNEEVKRFAQQMIDDHTKALTDVQQLAQARGVTLPSEPDARHKRMAAKLDKMNGAAFDKAYMAQAGLQDHKAVHGKLMSDQQRAKDPELKALAGRMTPVVEQHLKAAQQMNPVKAGTTSGK